MNGEFVVKRISKIRENRAIKKTKREGEALKKYLLSLHNAGKLTLARRTLLRELSEGKQKVHRQRVLELAEWHLTQGGHRDISVFNQHPLLAFLYPFQDSFKKTTLLKHLASTARGKDIIALPDEAGSVRLRKETNPKIIKNFLNEIEKK